MPGPVVTADKLPEFAFPLDEEVGRHLQSLDLLEVGVRIPVEPVGEQALHRITAKLARRQADGVQHHQIHQAVRRTRPEIG